jgi:hypothetical protein
MYRLKEAFQDTLSQFGGQEGPQENCSFLSLEEYQGNEGRLLGLQRLIQVQQELAPILPIQIPQVKIVPHEIFTLYRNNNCRLPEEVKQSLIPQIESMLEESPTNRVAVRRAFYIPGIDRPTGPTSNDLHTPNEVLDAFQMLFSSAINSGYDIEGAEINTYIQEWSDPPLNWPITQDTVLPAGGEALITSTKPDRILIRVRALFGDNAALKIAPELTDEWLVEFDNNGKFTVDPSPTVSKSIMFVENRRSLPPEIEARQMAESEFQEVSLPPGLQRRKALSDLDVIRAAHVVASLYQKYGSHRVEFSLGQYPGIDSSVLHFGIFFNEAQPLELEPYEEEEPKIIAHGRLTTVINEQPGVEYLFSKYSQREKSPLIVAIGSALAARRDQEAERIFRILLASQRPLTITVEASETEHFFRNLARGTIHTVIPIGTSTIAPGDLITITREKGHYIVINETLKDKPTTLMSLPEVLRRNMANIELIGGKALGCCQLIEKGFPVPLSFILTSDFFLSVLEKNGVLNAFNSISQAKTEQELTEIFAQIADGITRLPRSWKRDRRLLLVNARVKPTNEDRKREIFAVRSSTTFEDRPDMPFAGILESQLYVSSQDLGNAVKQVIRSAFTPRVASRIWSASPNPRKELLKTLKVPVLVQEMIEAEASGVLFGQEISGERRKNIVIIEAELGAGGIVSGDQQRSKILIKYDTQARHPESIFIKHPSSFSEAKMTEDEYQRLRPNRVDRSQIILYHSEARELIETAIQLANQLNGPQDTEFAVGTGAISGEEKIWYIQTRPL